eukprot:gene1941-16450_t
MSTFYNGLMGTDLQLSPLGLKGLQNEVKNDLDKLVLLYRDTLSALLDKPAPLKTRSLNFKSKRNEFLYQQNTAKQKYYSDKIEESQEAQRKLFKLVKSIMKPEDRVKYPTSSSTKNLTNEFNEYFITKIDLIREELDEIEMDTTPSEYLMDYKQVKEFSAFESLSEDRVKQLIMKSPNKQCSSDPIPTWTLKECLDIILPFVSHIINSSLQTDHFAEAWKEALLSPLLKNSTFDIIFPNLRPVSNLPFVSKLVERSSSEQVLSHMSENRPMPFSSRLTRRTAVQKLHC